MLRLRAFVFAALIAGGVVAAPHAHASVSFTVVMDSLVQESSAAILATPIEVKSVWEGGRIATYTRVHVDRTFVGSASSEVWVKTMGGVVGQIGQLVDGEAVLRSGQQSVLFLSSFGGSTVVTARGQGQFPIVKDASGALRLRKNAHAGALLAARTTTSAPAADVLDGKTIDDAQIEIAASWQRTHAHP